ncbi:peptidase domain containing associated with muscle regeneration 1 [Phyllostomus discolor]|uniref:Peptidase domain containing associated with muscle regeneration 1 n=1 Tax=Phyllostomus discolor TaxID=89673 RepID=A0A834E2L7_9CHIR|nr:peptidase domain containing associated with muscle regeneration 1 [Phyllostomus discolor]
MELGWWTQLALTFLQLLLVSPLPREYTVINEACPGAEWNIMCRECCEYDQIECVCPGKKEVVGYTIPCCRNEDNECDSCLIHPGCTIFENCKTCRNGSWGGTLDDFYVKGIYCAECRAGWYGGDCMREYAPRPLRLSSPVHAVSVSQPAARRLRFLLLGCEFWKACGLGAL